MLSQAELYERFRDLHERPGGFIMPNPWDGASALLMKDAGFEALGTSSAAIALSLGRMDGRRAVSRDEHLANARLLIRVSTSAVISANSAAARILRVFPPHPAPR